MPASTVAARDEHNFAVQIGHVWCLLPAEEARMLPRQSCKRVQRIRLNQSSESPADSSASNAAPMANSAEISVSFFSTVRRELNVS